MVNPKEEIKSMKTKVGSKIHSFTDKEKTPGNSEKGADSPIKKITDRIKKLFKC